MHVYYWRVSVRAASWVGVMWAHGLHHICFLKAVLPACDCVFWRLLHNILKNYNKDGRDKNAVEDISSCGSCQGSFIHLSCLCESSPSSHHMNTHLHSHPCSACGSASKHLPDGLCCLHFTASLIDLASSVSWRDLHLGQPNLNPSLGCRLKVSNSSDAPFDYFLSPRIWKQGGEIKLLFFPFCCMCWKLSLCICPFP